MKDQIAVVTGGSQGIGLGVARLLAEQCARVASWDIDPGNGAAMSGLSDGTLAIECDITDLASVEAAYARTCDLLGTPSILVNSAGIAGPNAPMDSYGIGDWHRVMDINLNGTFYVNRVCVPGMKEAGYGRILNVASIAGKEGNPNASAYSASKAAVIGISGQYVVMWVMYQTKGLSLMGLQGIRTAGTGEANSRGVSRHTEA